MHEDTATEKILELERKAMERWAHGDPDGFLEISAPEVSYFDPFLQQRLDGLDALRDLYNQLRGKVRLDSFEFLHPKIQVTGDVAVLTFNFQSRGSEGAMLWNTTEVYRRLGADWRIIHTHWSFTQPKLATS